MKYKVVLFQSHLRKPILNFQETLKSFEFVIRRKNGRGDSYKELPNFEDEVRRVKVNKISTFRRFFGILNLRPYFDKEADLFFTYACLLITNKPYFIYIENGSALFNYDMKVVQNKIAQIAFQFFIRQKACRGLIFMNKTAKKSLLANYPYSDRTKKVIERKSYQVYPIANHKTASLKSYRGTIKLLFIGLFYMKGGQELIGAFQKLREEYTNVTLTIVTPCHVMKKEDLEQCSQLEGVKFIDAALNEKEMEALYREHDILMHPTYRDSFPMVVLEALSYNMPIICTDQYAIPEVAVHGFNAFVHSHPLKDYDPLTFRQIGKYRNPQDFYSDLFQLQRNGDLQEIEQFLYHSIKAFLTNPSLLDQYSKNAETHYKEHFNPALLTNKLEQIFLKTLK